MIISMFKIFCITNRRLCSGDFLEQIEKIAAAKPERIMLREKDLDPESYRDLAKKVIEICRRYDVPCSLYKYYDDHGDFHLPCDMISEIREKHPEKKLYIGTSVHSVEDALNAEKAGADYIIAGHIFPTDCKKGLPPRGLGFLENVCRSVNIPVYAIGGISSQNIDNVIAAGAAGGCIMSGLMQCTDPMKPLKGT